MVYYLFCVNIGFMYRYYLDMDSIVGRELVVDNMVFEVLGNV